MSRHYLFVTWDGAGNLPPQLSLVRELTARGHRVTVLADPTVRAEAEGAGAAFRAWVEAPHLTSREDHYLRDWEAKSPPQQVARLCDRLIAGPAAAQARETLAAIRETRPEVLVADAMLLGPQVVAEAEGLPLVALLGNTYPLPAPGLPPFGTGWPPARGPLGRARDAAVGRVGTRLWRRGRPGVNAARAERGLSPLSDMWAQLDRAKHVLLLTSERFDFPGTLPANVSYVGPRLDDPAWVGAWEPPAGDAPLVLASLSSGAQGQREVLGRIVEALGRLPVRGVVTTGHAIDPADLAAPAHVQVVRSAPHARVLGHAAAVVTHGGHGTVVKGLAAGVPELVLPMGRDQLDNAARVVAAGAGLRLKPAAKPAAIAAAVRRLLDEPEFGVAAERLGAVIRSDARSDAALRALEGAGATREDEGRAMAR